MPWHWIDRVIEFHSGRAARAIKRISLGETCLYEHFPGRPIMPASLILEGLGQTGMLLACEAIECSQLVVLAKVSSARFFFDVGPGDTLTYTAAINSLQDRGISVTAASHCNERLQAEAEIVYARLDEDLTGGREATARFLIRWMTLLGVFEVGRTAEGGPLRPPAGCERS